MAKLFGTDGVRGKANIYPMVPEFAMKLGQVAGTLVAMKHKRVAIGKDTRISGDMIETALVAGFTSVGVDVVLLGVVPTPTVTYLTPSLNVDMSIVISASHNPYFDNGIKLKGGDGDKLSNELTTKLEDAVVNNMPIELNPDKIGKVTYYKDAVKEYEKIYDAFSSLKGLKIVIDSANGAFSHIAPIVLEKLGAEVVAIGHTPNGININEGCGSTNTDLMCKTVISTKADIGLALDGDGDRILVCDEKGNKIAGEQIMGFFAGYFKSTGQLKGNGLVTTAFSNLGMAKYSKSQGLDYQIVDVGEFNIITKMREIGGNVGGEENGHIFLSDYSRSVDGLVVGVNLCLALLKLGKKMSDIFPVFKPFPTTITNIRFETREKAAASVDNPETQKAVAKANELLPTGSIITRKSGTEPVIRLCIQGEDEKVVNNVTQELKNIIESYR